MGQWFGLFCNGCFSELDVGICGLYCELVIFLSVEMYVLRLYVLPSSVLCPLQPQLLQRNSPFPLPERKNYIFSNVKFLH